MLFVRMFSMDAGLKEVSLKTIKPLRWFISSQVFFTSHHLTSPHWPWHVLHHQCARICSLIQLISFVFCSKFDQKFLQVLHLLYLQSYFQNVYTLPCFRIQTYNSRTSDIMRIEILTFGRYILSQATWRLYTELKVTALSLALRQRFGGWGFEVISSALNAPW